MLICSYCLLVSEPISSHTLTVDISLQFDACFINLSIMYANSATKFYFWSTEQGYFPFVVRTISTHKSQKFFNWGLLHWFYSIFDTYIENEYFYNTFVFYFHFFRTHLHLGVR